MSRSIRNETFCLYINPGLAGIDELLRSLDSSLSSSKSCDWNSEWRA